MSSSKKLGEAVAESWAPRCDVSLDASKRDTPTSAGNVDSRITNVHTGGVPNTMSQLSDMARSPTGVMAAAHEAATPFGTSPVGTMPEFSSLAGAHASGTLGVMSDISDVATEMHTGRVAELISHFSDAADSISSVAAAAREAAAPFRSSFGAMPELSDLVGIHASGIVDAVPKASDLAGGVHPTGVSATMSQLSDIARSPTGVMAAAHEAATPFPSSVGVAGSPELTDAFTARISNANGGAETRTNLESEFDRAPYWLLLASLAVAISHQKAVIAVTTDALQAAGFIWSMLVALHRRYPAEMAAVGTLVVVRALMIAVLNQIRS